jgi:hypothetical protein
MLQFQPPLLKTDLKLPSQKTVLEIQLPQYEFPIRIITTPYANESRLKRYLGAENKEEQLNQLLQDSWAALADKYCDTKGVNILTTHLYMLKRGGEILEEPDGENHCVLEMPISFIQIAFRIKFNIRLWGTCIVFRM